MPLTNAPPHDPPAEERAVDAFDLTRMRGPDFSAVRKTCDAAAARPGEIVVCAPDPERERLRSLPQAHAATEGPPRAEWSLGDGITTNVQLDSEALPGGIVSNRVMAGVKLEF